MRVFLFDHDAVLEMSEPGEVGASIVFSVVKRKGKGRSDWVSREDSPLIFVLPGITHVWVELEWKILDCEVGVFGAWRGAELLECCAFRV